MLTGAVEVNGTALTSGLITLTENPDNLVRREHGFDPGNYPFGMTWNPGDAGVYHVNVVAEDSSGNRVPSGTVLVTSTTGSGALPTIELAPFPTPQFGTATLDLTAEAEDSDGEVLGVEFFVDGAQVGPTQTTAPYMATSAALGLGEHVAYAVVIDDLVIASIPKSS